MAVFLAALLRCEILGFPCPRRAHEKLKKTTNDGSPNWEVQVALNSLVFLQGNVTNPDDEAIQGFSERLSNRGMHSIQGKLINIKVGVIISVPSI